MELIIPLWPNRVFIGEAFYVSKIFRGKEGFAANSEKSFPLKVLKALIVYVFFLLAR